MSEEVKYWESSDFEKIAKRVVNENAEFAQIKTGAVRIAYQESSVQRKRGGGVVYADTEKVKDKLKEFLPYDFIVTIYPEGSALDAEHRYRLIYHELLHVGYDPETEKFSIIQHDCEDFRACLAKWGTDWIIN